MRHWPMSRAGRAAQQNDAVGQQQRLVDVMGDQHDGGAEIGDDAQQQLLHLGRG